MISSIFCCGHVSCGGGGTPAKEDFSRCNKVSSYDNSLFFTSDSFLNKLSLKHVSSSPEKKKKRQITI